MRDSTTPVHISVVLDRSGSMAPIADDIVGGFNTYLDEQRRQRGAGRITLVQFDNEAPFEVLIDGEDLATAGHLEAGRYLPRGTTPLYDAVGRMIARVDRGILDRADQGLPIEDQVVLIVTDGLENASREFTGEVLAGLVKQRRALGWVFAFLGTDEESFYDASRIEVARGNVARWDPTPGGSREAFRLASEATSKYRLLDPDAKRAKADKFFEEGDDPGD